jgi:hypothetical protein
MYVTLPKKVFAFYSKLSCIYVFLGFDVFLLLVSGNLFETNRHFTVEMGSSICDCDVCDSLISSDYRKFPPEIYFKYLKEMK